MNKGKLAVLVVIVAGVAAFFAFDLRQYFSVEYFQSQRAAIEAQGRVGIMLNVRNQDLKGVLALRPALQRPTISPLSEDGWVAVNTIIEERTVRDLIPRLKLAHAQGIVEYPLNKIVL